MSAEGETAEHVPTEPSVGKGDRRRLLAPVGDVALIRAQYLCAVCASAYEVHCRAVACCAPHTEGAVPVVTLPEAEP
ncbi:MAG: hypothetical protein R3324_00160 [Halobacteriales archaeon]|nr:hypothetical protein [Halobacteriales archaeon]